MKEIRTQINYEYANRLITLILLFSMVFIALSTVNTVSAANSSVIYVNDSGGNDDWNGEALVWDGSTLLGPKKSIKNATGTVAEGGTINITDGIYAGENNANITIDKNITIIGQSREGTIINGTNTTGIFLIQNGNNVTIFNLTIANCTTSKGGSILNNGTLTVNNSIFTGNTAFGGGAIVNGGNLTVIDSIFTNNAVNSTDSTSIGGAIANIGTLTVTGSTFTGNTADNGGAILNYGNSTVKDSIFINNTAITGGAIFNYGNSTTISNLNIENSTFINNTASGTNTAFGGAISNYGNSTVNISTFTGNKASNENNTASGGAISNVGTLTIKDSKFTSNIANYGGAIFNGGDLIVNAGTFTSNIVVSTNDTAFGGAIFNYGNSTINGSTFTNNTINSTNNTASGGAISNAGTLTVDNSTFTYNSAKSTSSNRFYGGGAISNDDALTVKNSKFIGNIADYGGAIYNDGTSTVTGSTFTGNTARSTDNNSDGGAISNYYGILNVSGSTFTGNIADYGGAISSLNSSTVTVSGSTFKNNGATTDGDAIYNEGKLIVHFSWIVGNYIPGYTSEDVYNYGGSADVKYNWWGSNAGPSTGRVVGCTYAPWLVLTINANYPIIKNGVTSTITVDLLHDSKGYYHSSASGNVPDGIPVTFTTTLGTITSHSLSIANGIAQSTLKGGSVSGTAKFSAKVDSQTVTKYIMIDNIPPKVVLTSPRNYATGVSRTSTIYIKFSEKIKTSINWSKIYVKNLSTGKLVSVSKWISNNILCIKTNYKRNAYNWYMVYIPNGAVKDYAGNNLAARYVFKFKTGRY